MERQDTVIEDATLLAEALVFLSDGLRRGLQGEENGDDYACFGAVYNLNVYLAHHPDLFTVISKYTGGTHEIIDPGTTRPNP